MTIPGFYYRAYTVSGNNPERYTTAGAISWKARFAPSILGSYTCDIAVKDVDGTATVTNAGSFTCQESGKKGFIKVDPNNHEFLKYDNGDTRIDIGQNIGWNNGSLPGGGIAGWDYFLKKLHNAGANWVRLWSCTYGADYGVAMEFPPGLWGNTYFQGPGKPSLQTSMRMDRYVEIAEQNDVAIQFCLQHHGQVSTTTNPDWDTNPYNIANTGGFLSDPCQYFTDANAIKLTKNKYRYIVARWGYSPAIYAWELFNEVQWTNGWKSQQANVIAWHNTMASYIRSIDKFKHPVTTSSHGSGVENLWNLPDINLVQMHYYGNDTIRTFEQTALSLADFNKPVLMAEFGLGGGPEGSTQPEPYATQLKEGLEMHNGIWIAFFAKSSGHLWWWDNYIDPCNLYGVYTPLSVYAANENLADCNLTRAQRAASGNEAYFANPVLTGERFPHKRCFTSRAITFRGWEIFLAGFRVRGSRLSSRTPISI
ncbi:MAG: cellulase family glycosylhydrolase [Planctomycetota bacterium]